MKIKILAQILMLLLWAAFLHAQTAGPSLIVKQVGTTQASPGAALNFEVDLIGSAGANISAIAGLLVNSPAISNIQLGGAAVLAQKALTCDPAQQACTLVGLSSSTTNPNPGNLPLADGPILLFTYNVPSKPPVAVGSTITISFWNPTGANTNTSAETIALPTSGVTLTVGVNAACITQAQTLEASVNTSLIAKDSTAQTKLNQLIQLLNAISTTGACQ